MTNFDYINSIPGYISVVDLDLKYVLVNKNLSDLFRTNLNGKLAGSNCKEQLSSLEKLISSPVGTQVNWECSYKNLTLAACSLRGEDFIITQAIDISDRASLEKQLKISNQRNEILLQIIPEILFSSNINQNKLDLIKVLSASNQSGENINQSLGRTEVEIKNINERITKIEETLFQGHSCILERIRELEIYQRTDNQNWEEIDSVMDKINHLSSMLSIFLKTPGGFKTVIIFALIIQVLGIFVVDLGIRIFGIENLIPIERKK